MVEISPKYVKVFGESTLVEPHRVSDICPVDGAYYDIYAEGWKNYIRCGLYNDLVKMDVDGGIPAEFKRSLIKKIFIGLNYAKEDGPRGWPKPIDRDQGSSILLALKNGKNVFIGHTIFQFKSEKPILEYYSNVGNSSVPYPVALDANNVYFMLDKTYVPIKDIHQNHLIGPVEKGDLYVHYYKKYSKKAKPMKDVRVLSTPSLWCSSNDTIESE